MGFSIKGKLVGLEEAVKSMAHLKATARNKITRKAMTAATAPMLKTVRRLAAKETGLLRRSIARKVKTYRSSGTTVVIIGPRSGMKQAVTIRPDKVFREIRGKTIRIRRPRPEQLRMMRNPVRYAHLIEYGTSKRSARPFLRPAFHAHKAQAVAIAVEVIAAELRRLP